MEWITEFSSWISLITLILMEIILGIDNVIFIILLVNRLPEHKRNTARTTGLILAMLMRILLLLSIAWVMKLKATLISFHSYTLSGRDIILIAGGFFLLFKSSHEIHAAMVENQSSKNPKTQTTPKVQFLSTIIQIAIIDIVFSFDSVITAVGMADHVEIMIIAIVISVAVMLFMAKHIGEFVRKNPTIKMLAMSFLILIGVALIAEGLQFHIPKGYIYFSMAFSLAVELLNINKKKQVKDV